MSRGSDNGRESLEEALERTLEELSLLIGKRLVGVALAHTPLNSYLKTAGL
ncbi:hypothetical protein [Aeropyrum camini]|uniref:hypothetical protein n=1 Tax=Aeropyrum camini TaxID=229980 RepID=UPI0012E23D5A|nr:hypothetical protein [Aeropyrum camini]